MSMSDKQAKFRAEYKSNIHPAYNGWAHVLIIYAIGLTGIVFFVSQMQNPTWEWLIAIPVLFAANVLEWWVHTNVMHRRIDLPGLRQIYTRHTLQHHQYFTDDEMTIDGNREFRIIFFPPYALIAAMTLAIPAALVLGALLGANAGWVVMTAVTAHYLIYEAFHYSCHVHDNWFVRNMPFVNTIRRHHTAHHNQGIMMQKNMNLTFPVADWLFGTSDLDRGLLGHLFNGYSNEHVKEEIRNNPKTTMNPKTSP